MRFMVLTAAVAAMLAGFSGAAAAQTTQTPATQPPATQNPASGSVPKAQSTEHQTPGALTGALKGDINGPGAAKAAQPPAKGSKTDEEKSQDQQKQ
jgi:hypothetical protein